MKRIIIHWTAGNYYPSDYEKEHYHFLIDKDGRVHNGKFSPECNEICRVGKYAAHTGGGNTGSIGVAICAMAGFKSKILSVIILLLKNNLKVLWNFVPNFVKSTPLKLLRKML